MKKMITVVAIMAAMISNVAFAGSGGEKIDKRIKQAFEKEFSGAADVKWYAYDRYTKVDFTINSMHLMAFYNNEGESMGVARNIPYSSLPLRLQLDNKKNYKSYWITAIYELANGEGTRYYLTLENADKTIQFVSDANNSWELLNREAKK